ncbi:MAG: YdcF family protein [Candidatus Saccharimonadales bacterium]
MHELVEQDTKILWQYMQMHQAPAKADCLLVLGGRDDRVASYAAQLAQQFHYWYVVVSGGRSSHNEIAALWAEPTEAEHFAAVMVQAGYHKPILLEKKAQNTGQNAQYSFSLLQSRDTPMPLTIQLVTKTYMERRAIATFEAQWPDKDARFTVTSPRIDFNEYMNEVHLRERTINLMVGGMNRIIAYPELGYQSQQPVPTHVRAAYTRLVAAGYTDRLLDN